MKKMNPSDAKKFKKECCKFKDYKNIDEYIEDVVVCLIYSSWHYTEQQARECVEERRIYVEYAYEHKEPADDCCAEVGFHCG